LEAEIREAPGKAEAAADKFNALLDQALEAAEVLRGIHSTLQEKARAFNEIINQHQNACLKLGVVKPLDLKTGLGRLSKAPMPYNATFHVPNFDYFLGALIQYRAKLSGYNADPEWKPAPDPNAGKDFGPWSVNQRPNRTV
jgi:hypothetical protein